MNEFHSKGKTKLRKTEKRGKTPWTFEIPITQTNMINYLAMRAPSRGMLECPHLLCCDLEGMLERISWLMWWALEQTLRFPRSTHDVCRRMWSKTCKHSIYLWKIVSPSFDLVRRKKKLFQTGFYFCSIFVDCLTPQTVFSFILPSVCCNKRLNIF